MLIVNRSVLYRNQEKGGSARMVRRVKVGVASGQSQTRPFTKAGTPAPWKA
jgi:hypothetical protein